MKQMSQEKAANVLKKVINGFSEKDLETAHNSLVHVGNVGMEILEKIRIPIVSSNEDVLSYVEEFELTKPENFIRFLVGVAQAPAEIIGSGINELKEENLKECISTIRTQEENYLRRLKKNSNDFDVIFDKLCEASNILEDKIKMYVSKIQRIDNLSKWEFRLKVSTRDIDDSNYFAKIAVESYVRANNLYLIIASNSDESYQSRLDAYEDFIDNYLLKNGICRLMHAYDINQEEEFWLKIEELKKQVYYITDILNDINEEQEDFDEDNIDFS